MAVPKSMHLVTRDEYLEFLDAGLPARIGESTIEMRGKVVAGVGLRPRFYSREESTVWSFPNRGSWATHRGDYPGNWSPYVPRNLIEHFTGVGDLVLDPMMGSGTTLVECKLLGRNAVGVDLNLDAVMLAHDRLNFEVTEVPPCEIQLFWGDARALNEINTGSIDLITTHPPYAGIIKYGGTRDGGDLSAFDSISSYLEAVGDVANECFRVLKEGKHCAILIGDTRVHAHYVPISYMVMARFLITGFVLKEDIIKVQHNTSSDRGKWKGPAQHFYKIAHEHLFVFRKPMDPSDREGLPLSGSKMIRF